MTLPWLADVLRAAGLTVVEHAGWKTHDRPGDWSPRYGVVHATAAPRTQSDDVQVRVVRDGRSDLPGPIANATVDRRGRWHVLSAGRCNSTLTGTAGPFEGLGNTYALSTEACNDNRTEPWPDVQYQAYVRGWTAWCRRLGWTAARLVGHKEHTPGHKSDPTFNMDQFRRDVAAVLAGEDDDMTKDEVRDAVLEALQTALPLPGRIGERMVAAGWGAEMEPWTALGRVMEFVVLGRDRLVADVAAAVAALPREPGAAVDYEQLADAIVRRAVGATPQS